MCQQWLLKYKACGHFERDEERVYCELYDSSYPDFCLQCFEADIIREYTPGDGKCCRCLCRDFLDAQWDRTISTKMDDARLAFSIAREVLFSFNFVTMVDLEKVQNLLTYTYLSQGIVLDVRLILKIFGYQNPELETEVKVDSQNRWNREPSPIPTLEEYMLQFAPTPTPDPALLSTPMPTQDLEANQYSYDTPLSYIPTPWSSGVSEM